MVNIINTVFSLVRSRFLFSNLNGGKGAEPFEAMLREVLLSLVKLMFASQAELLPVQASCLQVNTVLSLVNILNTVSSLVN